MRVAGVDRPRPPLGQAPSRCHPDHSLLALAVESERIVLTRDKDFGELVIRDGRPAAGVILLRLQAKNQAERLHLLIPHWSAIEAAFPGAIIVVTNDKIRIKPLPSQS